MKQKIFLAAGLAMLWAVSGCKSGSSDSSPGAGEASPPAASGNPPANVSQAPVTGLAAKIIATRKTDAAMLSQYTWNSRIELIEDEKIKDICIYLVSCGPNGRLQRSVINDESAPLPRGFIRRRIAEDERERLDNYVSGLRGLLDQYTQPATGRIVAFVSQAQISAPDANRLLELSGASVVMPGDAFNLWVDGAQCRTRKIQVTTLYEKDTVELTATFVTMKSGVTHLQYAEVKVPAKKLRFDVHNFDYIGN